MKIPVTVYETVTLKMTDYQNEAPEGVEVEFTNFGGQAYYKYVLESEEVRNFRKAEASDPEQGELSKGKRGYMKTYQIYVGTTKTDRLYALLKHEVQAYTSWHVNGFWELMDLPTEVILITLFPKELDYLVNKLKKELEQISICYQEVADLRFI